MDSQPAPTAPKAKPCPLTPEDRRQAEIRGAGLRIARVLYKAGEPMRRHIMEGKANLTVLDFRFGLKYLIDSNFAEVGLGERGRNDGSRGPLPKIYFLTPAGRTFVESHPETAAPAK